MRRNEQLKFCKNCKNQKFDLGQGVICGLTNSPADFEVSCNDFIEDYELKIQNDLKLTENDVLNKIASQGKRFTNYIIDLIFLYIFSFIFGITLGILIAVISPDYLSLFDEDSILLNYLIGFIAAMFYYSILEYSTGRTIAKFITKTKVINVNGEKPDFGAILIRSVVRFIPFEAFSFLGSESSGWHDKFSKTLVIDLKNTQ